jgi:dynactin 1
MRIAIEDLEALKELNDELEENHVETEKALQEEISKSITKLDEHILISRQTRKIRSSANKVEGLRALKMPYWIMRARSRNSEN